jgi:hypothetical protein
MGTITAEASSICDSITVHPKSFIHQSTKLPHTRTKVLFGFYTGFLQEVSHAVGTICALLQLND